MTIANLIAEVREDIIDDVKLDYRHSDTQLTRFANEAIKEACIRAPLIVANKTISIIAGTSEYALDDFTRQIMTAKLALSTYPLEQETEDGLTIRFGSDWRERSETPRNYIRFNRTIKLYPKPIVNDTLTIKVSRIPDSNFNLDTDIESDYYDSLKYYIAFKCFSQRDNDNYDPVKAADFLSRFELMFGVKHSAKYESVSFNSPMYATVIGGRMC